MYFTASGPPAFSVPKYDLKKHPNYGQTSEADKNCNAFDITRLVTRRMKLDPNEQYTVYEVDADEAETDIAQYNVSGDIDADILNYVDVDDPEAFA